ncbi:helix-turn-helix and ligand-binding sensor domain-containing protein [Foetidibacter luteolus]|uniref:helix-turn-helix and ligand-binding sensor domain-containing protein n=1 Tax=Foetidibacter luteolus TaxID=2608880 RepID=UPI00129A25FB|nr:triple tyrosine motif-containing protein [Foetidibacter luteolus]
MYETNNGNILEKGGINKFSESSRYVETDGATIWVSHPYRGIYKITLPDYTVTHYNQKDGLPDDLDNHVFKIKGKILFATKKGIYEYNKQNDKMQKAKDYALLFGNRPVRYLTEDDKGNIWFVQDKMVGVADYTNQNPVINYIPELKNKIVSGFENIFPYNTSNVIVGGQDGFYNIDYQKYHQSIQPFTAYITSVKIIGSTDSILYGGYSLNSLVNKPALPYKHNSLHFAYSASIVHLNTELEFSYFLQGFDKGWSIWEQTSTKDYTNLPAGSYVFHVKARNGPSQESKEYTYSFKISPPWYKTLWAYILYVLTLFEALYLLFKHQVRKQKQKMEAKRQEDQKKFEEEQRQMAYLHRLQMEQSEKELIRLQNEKLEVEIERKNAELANTALNLVQKKEYLSKIADILNKLNKPGNEPIEPGELKKLLRSLGSEEKLDEEWRQFSIHFNNVHNNFLITLQNKYPGLKPHELRLCAYLRMNLSSKEMARLLSISVRGVEISRYRLRKKLQLQPKEDLFQFLMQVDAEGKSPKQNNQTSESTT